MGYGWGSRENCECRGGWVRDKLKATVIGRPTLLDWKFKVNECPACGWREVLVTHREWQHSTDVTLDINAAPPAHVPEAIRVDWDEARAVLWSSPNGTAVLARRCLEGTLRHLGWNEHGLAKNVTALLKAAPQLKENMRLPLNVILELGNIAAHPQYRLDDREVINVQRHEAEFVLGMLLDFFALLPGAQESSD